MRRCIISLLKPEKRERLKISTLRQILRPRNLFLMKTKFIRIIIKLNFKGKLSSLKDKLKLYHF